MGLLQSGSLPKKRGKEKKKQSKKKREKVKKRSKKKRGSKDKSQLQKKKKSKQRNPVPLPVLERLKFAPGEYTSPAEPKPSKA